MRSLAVALAMIVAGQSASAMAAAPLELVGTVPMPGVKGRIDHLAADNRDHLLFVAALGNDTLEVLDGSGGRRTVAGFGEPQGIAFVADTGQLFVANGTDARVDVFDAASLARTSRIEGLDDADNVRYDVESRSIIVGYGRGALAFIDAQSHRVAGRVELPGHPESFQLEERGRRLFVNVPGSRKIVVVDRRARVVLGSWDVEGALGNYAMALDETGGRLFIATRMPARLLVYDVASGRAVARLPIGGDVDDLFYDPARKRVYAVCGEGRVDVVRQESADHYVLEASASTAPGARTGLYVASEGKLYVAAPADGTAPARILVFRVR